MDTLVADAGRAALLAIACEAMADFAEAGQLLDVDMDQVSGMLPLEALYWRFGLLIPQPPQTKAIAHPGHGGDGDPRPAAVAADRASAAGCDENSVDPPMQLLHLSGSGSVTCMHSGG